MPIVEGAESGAKDEYEQSVMHSFKHETLLLVDDEPLLLHAMKEVLEELGYQVVKANNGAQGFERFLKHQDRIVAIVTDVVMPEMGGVDMFRKIRAVNNRMPTIFMTGYDQGQIKLRSDEKENTLTLSKPVKISELSHHIQTILKQAEAREPLNKS